METKDNFTIDTMRKQRNTYESIFTQFVSSSKFYNSYAFCFYEGEDGKYYDNRIRNIFSDDFLTFTVGNKKEVIKLLHKLKETELYDRVCMMFFVDRDFDDSLIGIDNDLYETPCYSIENLYVQEECFKHILQSEFGLNCIDTDYVKCLQDYKLREDEFNNLLLEFNSLAFLRRKRTMSNSDYSFGSIKTSHLVNIGIDKVVESTKYKETIQNIKRTLGFDDAEMEIGIRLLNERGKYSWNFRGKNQLDFFVSFVRQLKELNAKETYFTAKHNNIHIDITSNRLSELSQYAITPPELMSFLEEHGKKMNNLA